MTVSPKRKELARDWVGTKPEADRLVSGLARVATLWGKGHRVKAEPATPWGYYVVVTVPEQQES